MMKLRALFFAVSFALAPFAAFAQTGQIPSGTVWGNSTAARAPASAATPTALLDRTMCGTQGSVLYRNAATWVCLTPGTSGTILRSGGAAANPAWSTSTYPAAVGAAGTILRSDGTNFVSTTATYPASTTSQQILYSTGANVVGELSTLSGAIPNTSNLGTLSMTQTPILGVAGTATGTLGFSGLTSGTATLTAQAAAGTPTLTLPNTSGTFAVGVAAPLTLSTTTGGIGWSGTSGGVPYFSSATTAASSGALTANALVLGGGAGAAPSTPVGLGTTTTVLHGNAAGAPSYAAVANGDLATATANTVKGNFTGASATPSDNAVPSCSTVNSGLQYTTSSGLGCRTSFADLVTADQTLAGGANVTAQSLTTGNVTIDCGSRPIQTITNNGAYTITAPASDGYCLLKVTNGATAGATTFTGFSVGANTGDALTTTNASKFIISIIRAGGDSTYSIKALQ